MHKYVHYRSRLPAAFSTYFDENKLIHQNMTQQKNDFHIHIVYCEIGKKKY